MYSIRTYSTIQQIRDIDIIIFNVQINKFNGVFVYILLVWFVPRNGLNMGRQRQKEAHWNRSDTFIQIELINSRESQTIIDEDDDDDDGANIQKELCKIMRNKIREKKTQIKI